MPALISRAELDQMPRIPGICAYCARDTMVYALILFTCRKCALDDMEAHSETPLTRAEAAYAHLASFQRGDTVDVGGRAFFMPGTVTQAQQSPSGSLEDAFVVVAGTPATNGARQTVRVSDLLSGDRTIITWDDAKAGNVRHFDAATWAMQNPEG